MFNQKNVAFVITDPQVEFLKSTGKDSGATKDVLEKVNTIENLTKLFALAKERGYKRFISPTTSIHTITSGNLKLLVKR